MPLYQAAMDTHVAHCAHGDSSMVLRDADAVRLDIHRAPPWLIGRNSVTYIASRSAPKQCADWLSACLKLGWEKGQLDFLQALWWKYHDDDGNLYAAGVTRSDGDNSDV